MQKTVSIILTAILAAAAQAVPQEKAPRPLKLTHGECVYKLKAKAGERYSFVNEIDGAWLYASTALDLRHANGKKPYFQLSRHRNTKKPRISYTYGMEKGRHILHIRRNQTIREICLGFDNP